jgi:hypothetical protein
MFGKRNPPPPPAADQAQGHRGSDEGRDADSELPWSGDAENKIACNLAAGNLANNLPRRLTREGRIHAETYVAAAGAIAGFAAQCSLLATADAATLANLQTAVTQSGARFLFGDPLNDVLLARTESEARGRVWPVAASAAVAAGLAKGAALDLAPMFEHVASTIGSDREGLPSVPAQHHPHLAGRDLLKVVWPMAVEFFAADFDEFHRRFGPVPKKWWGAVAAFGSGRPILEVKDVLAPDLALTILMETAIYTSKLDRALIEQA